MGTTPSLFGRFVVARATANDPLETLYKEALFNRSIEQTFIPRDKSGMILQHKGSGEFYTRDAAVDYLASRASGSQEAKDLPNFHKRILQHEESAAADYLASRVPRPQEAKDSPNFYKMIILQPLNKEFGEFYTRDAAVDYSQEAKDLSDFYKIKDDWQKMRAFEAKLNEVKKEEPNYKLPDEYQKMYEKQKDKLVQKRLSQNSVSQYEPQGEQVIIDKDASYSRARAGAASNRKKRATTILTGGSDSSLGLGSKSVGKVTLLGI